MGKTKMSGIEQMLHLCTLMPFGHEEKYENIVETHLTMNWRLAEMRFHEPATNSNLVLPFDTDNFNWLPLIGSEFCRVFGLVAYSKTAHGISLLKPVGVRVLLNRLAILEAFTKYKCCSSNFLAFENFLHDALTSGPYVFESTGGKKHKQDSCYKDLDIEKDLKIVDGLYWNYELQYFSQEKQSPIQGVKCCPMYVVSTCTTNWMHTVLEYANANTAPNKRQQVPNVETLDAMHVTLIITNEPRIWRDKCQEFHVACAIANGGGVSYDLLAKIKVLIVTCYSLEQETADMINLEESTVTGLHVHTQNEVFSTYPKYSSEQLRRYIKEILCKKFSNFSVPVSNMVQFGLVVYDDMQHLDLASLSSMHIAHAKKLHIFYDDSPKPTGISVKEVRSAYRGLPKWSYPHVLHQLEQNFMTVVPVPKAVLKKFKLFSHQIRNSAVEERIARTFSTRYCPLSMECSLQRFSSKSMPRHVAKGLIENHLNRLETSLGTYLDSTTKEAHDKINKTFVLETLSQATLECCICYTSCTPIGMTLCGHVYCASCERDYFTETWNQNKIKECAQCRTALTLGDFFVLDESRSYVPVVKSKEHAIKDFSESIRNKNFLLWSSNVVDSSKHLIVDNLNDISAKQIIQRFYKDPCQTCLHVHVFYNPNETVQFHKLFQDF